MQGAERGLSDTTVEQLAEEAGATAREALEQKLEEAGVLHQLQAQAFEHARAGEDTPSIAAALKEQALSLLPSHSRAALLQLIRSSLQQQPSSSASRA